MVIQTLTNATIYSHHSEPLLLNTVDRTCQLNHTNHILSKPVLFITAIHLVKPAIQALVLISQVLMARFLRSLDHMVNQLNQ
jgi:hypothetical protein